MKPSFFSLLTWDLAADSRCNLYTAKRRACSRSSSKRLLLKDVRPVLRPPPVGPVGESSDCLRFLDGLLAVCLSAFSSDSSSIVERAVVAVYAWIQHLSCRSVC